MRRLVVISHTEHQKKLNGEVVGWGPTVNELNHLTGQWEEIVHIACLESRPVSGSSIPYQKSIRFVSIPTFGGKYLINKLDILWKIPGILCRVKRELRGATHVQLRLPMGIGPFLLLYFFIRRRDFILWIKYANNWNADNIPWSNKLQRLILKKDFLKCKVTINGFWENQSLNCYSFENPCLELDDIEFGREVIESKKFDLKPVLIFVGGLEIAKGIDIIVDFLKIVREHEIEFFHFVGEGELAQYLKDFLSETKLKFQVHGGLSQKELHALFATSNYILLPSRSEGFPKVLAEAMCFGCIPICSNVGSIGHYVKNGINGFMMEDISKESLILAFNEACEKSSSERREIAINGHEASKLFTFESYLRKLNETILN